MSSARPQTRGAISEEPDEDSPRSRAVNRKIDFGGVNRNRKSLHVVDAESPFKPKHKLRRSTGPATRPSVYDYETDGTALETIEQTQTNGLGEDESVELSIEGDDEPAPVDDYDSAPVDIEQLDVSFEEPARRKRGRPRKSDQSNASQTQESPKTSGIASSSGAKRSRTSLRDETEVEAGPSRKKTRTSGGSTIVEQQGEEVEIDPADIAHGDEYLDAMGQEDQPQLDSQLEAQPEPGPTKKGKGGRPRGKKGKAVAALKPGEGAKGSPIKINASPSKKRSGSAGPMSNVNLRAHTPFDDANQTTSRAGRNLIQPLKFWANENRIWKNGEIEGIIRAEPVEQSRRKPLKRKKRSRKRLHDIEEESDSESIMPDEWEDNMGVITGNVASWNPETRQGDPEDPYQEGTFVCGCLLSYWEPTAYFLTDLAFAASSIITRDVAGSDFKYAKIMTLPFFGAGIVEIPPEGYKRAKNSRKMQMVFFVHQGKVSVEVGATGMEVNSFPLSKGGVWIVPRGKHFFLLLLLYLVVITLTLIPSPETLHALYRKTSRQPRHDFGTRLVSNDLATMDWMHWCVDTLLDHSKQR